MSVMVGGTRGYIPGGGQATTVPEAGGEPPATRDPLQQPFASNSLWNMPIGSGATYTSAGFTVPAPATFAEFPGVDPMRICLTPAAPSTQVAYSSAGWSGSNRCAPTGGSAGNLPVNVPMPTDYIVPNTNKNECATFLAADGQTVIQVQPLARCTAGQPATSIVRFLPDQDLYADGRRGAQGGTGLSAFGGTIRLGELRPGQQGPPHVLKVIIDTGKYLYQSANNFRWPAYGSDSGGGQTTIPDMLYGALLALHPSSTFPTTLRTEPGRQLAWTLQNYGAYIVDGTGAEVFLFAAEDGYHGSFLSQFQSDWGFAFDRRANETGNWVSDIHDIIPSLQVVTNNAENNVGGGGTPRVPLAPEI